MMIQVPSTDGKKNKSEPFKISPFAAVLSPGAIQSIQQNRHNKNADFLLVFIRLPEKRSDRYPSHMHIQRGTEKIPVNFFFLRPVKICLAFDNRNRLHSQHFGALCCLTPFPVPRRLSPPLSRLARRLRTCKNTSTCGDAATYAPRRIAVPAVLRFEIFFFIPILNKPL